MLSRLQLTDTGPFRQLEVAFAPRLNVLTGDNGLGKSFLLDAAWYASTWSWAGRPFLPHSEARADDAAQPGQGRFATSRITSTFDDGRRYDNGFHLDDQRWSPRTATAGFTGGPRMLESAFPGDGLVVYARVDGGFAVWDAYRNRGRTDAADGEARPRAFVLDRDQVWNGLEVDGRPQSNGLIRDWVSWQQGANGAYAQLVAAVDRLSGAGVERMRIGQPRRISVDDTRDFPTLDLPYGTVPLTHASAGMRRICALAYVLVWTWNEHRLAAELRKAPPVSDLLLLVDEVEAHLHPEWQRRIVPALLSVVSELAPQVQVQLIVATHAPLVLASLEPVFDPGKDATFHLDLHGDALSVDQVPFARQGDAAGWLVSDTFGLAQARSVDAQDAIEAAEALMRGRSTPEQREGVHARLVATLGDLDHFWPRWVSWRHRTPA